MLQQLPSHCRPGVHRRLHLGVRPVEDLPDPPSGGPRLLRVRGGAQAAPGEEEAGRAVRRPPRRVLRGRLGRGGRHHRPERCRQEHPAQDHQPDHRPHHRPHRARRPGGQPPRGGDRIPSRAHRAGERLPQRDPARHAPQGDRRALRRHRGVRRDRAIPRHPGQAVLDRDVHPAGLRRGRPPGQRDPGGRRGAGRGRLRLPGQVPPQDARGGPGRPHRAAGQPPAADGVRPVHLGPLPRAPAIWCSTARSKRRWRSTSAASPDRRRCCRWPPTGRAPASSGSRRWRWPTTSPSPARTWWSSSPWGPTPTSAAATTSRASSTTRTAW